MSNRKVIKNFGTIFVSNKKNFTFYFEMSKISINFALERVKLMRRFKQILLAISLFLTMSTANAQLAQFQSLYVFNFAKNIGWPTEDASREVVITVVSDPQLAKELTNLTKNKKVGLRPIVVKESSSILGIAASDIICVGADKVGQLRSLVNAQSGKKNFIISTTKGQCPSGACVSFYVSNGKLKFEISESNIKKRGLSVAQKMVQLGTPVAGM